MLIADIKGKLSLSEMVSEDYLTSAVFSVFRYLNPCYLQKFLCQAENIHKEKFNICIEKPLYSFWPWFGNGLRYGGGAEPDVVIYSGETAIIIEAKNYAGKSGEGIAVDKENVETIVDQLGREYFVGSKVLLNRVQVCDEEECKVKSFNLVFLTRHSFFPYSEIEESIKAIEQIDDREKAIASKNIFWLNWNKVVPIMEDILTQNPKESIEYKICMELLAFLDRREINYFRGFDFLCNCDEFTNELIDEGLFYFEKEKIYWESFEGKEILSLDIKNIFYEYAESNYWRKIDWNENITASKKIFYGEAYE